MFSKVLIANRGEIAVRIIRACHELGIATVALYQASDRSSLHVRLADESVLLDSPAGFFDQQAILDIAKDRNVDAVHPGYGFLSERDEFARACQSLSLAFIGPSAEIIEQVRQKIEVLHKANRHGFPVPSHSDVVFSVGEMANLRMEAGRMGYPLIVKSSRGGRGRGARLVWSEDHLETAVHWAQVESQVIYGTQEVYLERAVLPAHQVGVQIVGDQRGQLVHLGEREGSLIYGNQKIIEEAPAPCLDTEKRQQIWQAALDLGRVFNIQNVCTIEFLVDGEGRFYFTEIKPRIQIEHPLTEMLTRRDLVREQIRIAAGESLSFEQDDVLLHGWSMQCRISAADPWKQYLPSPGRVLHVRWPGGPGVRVDSYLTDECEIPTEYDPLIAKLVIWGHDRQACIGRMRNALQECQLTGAATNLPLIQRILDQPGFLNGVYTTEFLMNPFDGAAEPETRLRDLAVVAAIAYLQQTQASIPEVPDRLLTGWHRSIRRLSS